MATSFATYASQFLTRQQQPTSPASSQPLFFSFTTDESASGFPPGADLDDLDDPHLRGSAESQEPPNIEPGYIVDDDDEDPYLRLDEDDNPAASKYSPRYNPPSAPLIASEIGGSDRAESPKGWLAHQASPLRRSPSPSPTTSSDSGPPADLFNHSPLMQPPPPATSRAPVSLSLTESLLPRDGRARPIDVFSLPDPRHTPRGRRKYNDSVWTALWCTGVGVCLFSALLLLFIAPKPRKPTGSRRLPYTTLLHTVPLLTILTFLSAAAAYAHIFLLQIFVRPVMFATSVFIPATLFISAIWAFIGSFMWEEGSEPTWGETVGYVSISTWPSTS